MSDFGLPERTLQEMRAIFAKYSKVQKVVIYGSRAIGTHKPGSDIDLTLYGQDLTFNDLNVLAGALDDSSIPYLVDLSIFDALDHVKLKDHIDRVGQVFYDRYADWQTVKLTDVAEQVFYDRNAGWQTVKLGEVAEFIRGLTYSKKDETDNDGMAVLRATNIDLASYKLTFNEIRYVNDSVSVKDEKIAKKGDILVCTASGSKSHLGKVAIVEHDAGMAFGGFMAALRCNSQCLPKFLHLILTSHKFTSLLSALSDGTNINNLKFSQITNFEFSIPPIAEQERIVAKLDVLFAKIDTAITLADTKETEIQNLKTKLLAHTLNQNKANSTKWQTVKLTEVAEFTRGLTYSKKDESENDGIAVLRATNIDLASHKLTFNDIRYINDSVSVKDEKIAKKGDILVCTASGSKSHLGKAAIVEHDTCMAFGGFLAALRCNTKCLPKFLYLILTSHRFTSFLSALSEGASINNLKFSQIANFEFSLPKFAEQKRMVAKLEIAFKTLEVASNAVKQSKKQYQLLKSAILTQALYKETL